MNSDFDGDLSGPRVVAVVQGRLGSMRLPRKIVATIQGKPLVIFMLERLSACVSVHEVAVATTIEPGDAELAEVVKAAGYKCYRGSVDDLVSRLRGAAVELEADVLVRVWGDCPLVDPRMIDRAVEMMIGNDLDYVNTGLGPEPGVPIGLGFEAYRRRLLDAMDRELTSPFLREFPAEHVKRVHGSIAVGALPPLLGPKGFSVTVDYPEDLELVRAVVDRLSGDAASGAEAIVALFEREPELFERVADKPRNADFLAKQQDQER